MRAARPSGRAERSVGIALAAALALASAPLEAATLCHDLKGLFTPCPPGSRAAGRAHAAISTAPATAGDGETRAARKTSTNPPRIVRTKLCHDLKGLFTPCPG